MGFIQKDALRTTIVSYVGIGIGYINKALLFIIFLTTDQIGLINLLVSVGLLFANLAGFGVTQSTLKFFPFLRNKENRNHGFLSLVTIITLLGILLFTIVAIIFQSGIAKIYSEHSEAFVTYYYWIIPIGIASVLFIVLEGLLRSLYKNVMQVIANELVLRLVITALLLVYGFGLISFELFLVLHCLAYFIPVAILLIYLYRLKELHLFGRINISRRLRKIIVYFGFYSYLNTVGGIIVSALDALMIAQLLGLNETGVYTTVVYLVNALQVPYKSLVRISSPLVAKYWKEKDMKEMSLLYKKFSSVNLVIGMIMFLFIWTCRTELFHFLPAEFGEGVDVFLFLMIGRLVDMYFGLNGTIFVMSKKYRYDMLFTVLLIIVVVMLNLYLIPLLGITGAAIATTVAYLVYNFGRLLFVYRAYGIHPFERGQFNVILLFAGVVAFFELVPFPFGNEIVTIFVKWIVLTALFCLPIYYFRMEPEIVRYIENGFRFVKKRVKRS